MLTRDRICELIQERQDLLTKVKNSGLPVVIYGAGVGAGVAIQYLMANDITPTACMVDPPYYSEKMVKIYQDESGNEYTFPVYSTENIIDIYPKIAQIRGCCYNFYRHPNAAEYVTPVLPMGIFADLERITGEYVLENYEIFADVERLFDTNCPPPVYQHDKNLTSNDESKILYNAYLTSIITHNIDYLKGLAVFPQFFSPSLLKFTDYETVLDCGAFDGDTLISFMEEIGHKNFDHYYAVEPDPNTTKTLRNLIQTRWNGDSRIEVLNCGVGKENSELRFESSGSAASIFHPNGDCAVPVKKIDDLNIQHPVTFLKMDIEGMELAALEGAEKLIKRDKPKLAICVYHKKEDFLTIPYYLKKLVPEYQFKLGYHHYEWFDLVLYAYVP